MCEMTGHNNQFTTSAYSGYIKSHLFSFLSPPTFFFVLFFLPKIFWMNLLLLLPNFFPLAQWKIKTYPTRSRSAQITTNPTVYLSAVLTCWRARGKTCHLASLHTEVLWQSNNALFPRKHTFQIKSTKFQLLDRKAFKLNLKKTIISFFASYVSLQKSKIWNG